MKKFYWTYLFAHCSLVFVFRWGLAQVFDSQVLLSLLVLMQILWRYRPLFVCVTVRVPVFDAPILTLIPFGQFFEFFFTGFIFPPYPFLQLSSFEACDGSFDSGICSSHWGRWRTWWRIWSGLAHRIVRSYYAVVKRRYYLRFIHGMEPFHDLAQWLNRSGSNRPIWVIHDAE